MLSLTIASVVGFYLIGHSLKKNERLEMRRLRKKLYSL